MKFPKNNLSRKQIIVLISILCILLVIPLTLIFLQRTQIIKQNALEADRLCIPDDGSIPEGYTYHPGALEVWVVKTNSDPGSTTELGVIPGVSVHAEALMNTACENDPTCPNYPRSHTVSSPASGCGFSADGVTDSRGFTHLEPLNCGHNNFNVTTPSGLPPGLTYKGTTIVTNGVESSLTGIDKGQLALTNGTTDVIKIYFYEEVGPTPTNTPVPTPTETTGPTPTGTLTPSPTPTVTPTSTPTNTPTPTGTVTPTPTGTLTPSPTPTNTPTPTATVAPSPTPTRTPTPTPTSTPVPPTATSVPTPTRTPTPTATPVPPTPTRTPTPVAPTPTSTPVIAQSTPTATPTPVPTVIVVAPATPTPQIIVVARATPAPTMAPTGTNTTVLFGALGAIFAVIGFAILLRL